MLSGQLVPDDEYDHCSAVVLTSINHNRHDETLVDVVIHPVSEDETQEKCRPLENRMYYFESPLLVISPHCTRDFRYPEHSRDPGPHGYAQ